MPGTVSESESEMSSGIHSSSDLPSDIQAETTNTFDFAMIRDLLHDTYYMGPIPEGSSGSGLRQRHGALAGKPESHRTHVLDKAMNANLVFETQDGYVTTSRGANLAEEIAVCDQCGGEEVPAKVIPGRIRGRRTVSTSLTTLCPSCDDHLDDPDQDRVWRFERDDDSLEKAVEAVENTNAVLYLNDMTLSQANSYLS